MESSNKTVIIGAGVGGLAAGYFLQQAGRQVEIYERAAVPGGRIQLLEKDGARIDVGARLMTTLLNVLERTGGRFGLQTMCEGGGLANATIIERLS